jgi:hypothetical protein
MDIERPKSCWKRARRSCARDSGPRARSSSLTLLDAGCAGSKARAAMRPLEHSSAKASVSRHLHVDAATRTARSQLAINCDRRNGSNAQVFRASGYLCILHIEHDDLAVLTDFPLDRFDRFLTQQTSSTEHLNRLRQVISY